MEPPNQSGPGASWRLQAAACGPRPAALAFWGHSLVSSCFNTMSTLGVSAAPPRGISSMKAVLVRPGDVHSGFGSTFISSLHQLAAALLTFFLHIKAPWADLCSFSLHSKELFHRRDPRSSNLRSQTDLKVSPPVHHPRPLIRTDS